MDHEDPTVSFAKSWRAIANSLAKFQIPALTLVERQTCLVQWIRKTVWPKRNKNMEKIMAIKEEKIDYMPVPSMLKFSKNLSATLLNLQLIIDMYQVG